MRIDFMDLSTGEVYAQSSGVRVQNGKLVPETYGLPVLENPCLGCEPQDNDCEDCPWKEVSR